ncbi:MAG: hypothetical protein FJ318_07255 [SAR202 cluster bacterium]|nr:hypothetical protein [SAR202 cluster bacterium]
MKRSLRTPVLLALLVSVMGLLLAACGGSDPTATPTRPAATATPTPTTASGKTPVPGTTPVATPTSGAPATLAPNFKTEFRFLGTVSSYAPFFEGWKEMVRKSHGDKITFTVQDATEGDAVDYINRNPSRYTRTIFRLNEDHVPLWEVGLNFTGGKTISPRPQNLWMSFPAACMNWYTLDPKIKTMYEMKGKRVHMGTPSNTVLPVAERLVRAAGMEGQFTPVIGGAKLSQDALADRDVDVVGSGIIFAGHPLGSATAAYNQLAQLTGSFHFVSMPIEVIEKARKENPDWVKNGLLPPVKIYRGDLSRAAKVNYNIVQEDGYCVGSITVNFQTSPETEEAVVYAIVKAMIDNRDLADQYFAFISQVWKERLGHTWNPQSSFHPGARRAYQEAGVTYGIEGIREWESKFNRANFIAQWEAANKK